MYICPTCNKKFSTEDAVVKHYLKCWREKFPCHKSKAAPHSEDINTRETNKEVLNFFNSLSKR